MVVKLCHIPFHLITALIGVLLLLVMVVPAFIFASPILVLILTASNYLLIAVTSAYGVSSGPRKSLRNRLQKMYDRKYYSALLLCAGCGEFRLRFLQDEEMSKIRAGCLMHDFNR